MVCKMSNFVLRIPDWMHIELDKHVHRNGIKSRNQLIKIILERWIFSDERKGVIENENNNDEPKRN